MSFRTLAEFHAEAFRTGTRAGTLRLARDGTWRDSSARELGARATGLACALMGYGIGRGESVAVLTPLPEEALLADLAIHAFAGVCVPLDPGLPDGALLEILKDSSARLIFVSDVALLARILAIRPGLPSLDLVLLFRGPEEGRSPATLVETACEVGEERIGTESEFVAQATAASGPDSPACLAYRIGAGGGVERIRLTQRNLLAATEGLAAILELGGEDDVLSCLPPWEIGWLTLTQACFRSGADLTLRRPGGSPLVDIRGLRPSVVAMDSAALIACRDDALRESGIESWFRRPLVRWALRRGMERARPELASGKLPSERPWGFRVAEWVALDRIRRLHGGRLRSLVSLGSPLAPSESEFFFAAGIPLFEGLPLPEVAGVVTLNTRSALRPGSAGKALPGIELRAEPDGSLFARGAPVALEGSFRVAEGALREPWRRIGARGRVDADGYLWSA